MRFKMTPEERKKRRGEREWERRQRQAALTDFGFHKGGVGWVRAPARAPACARSRAALRATPEGGLYRLPSPNLVCDALDRASPDAERLGHLQDTNTLRKLFSHLPFGRAVYLRPTEFHALGDSTPETCFDPLPDHRPLKLSKSAG
jgi:hypothetical protein